MIIIIAEEGKKIHLGRVGENEARAVRFDIGKIQAEFPGATFSVLNMRPEDPDAYPVNGQYIRIVGNYLYWTLQSGDLTQDALGECELKATVDGVIVKSIIWTTEICPALDGNGEPPEPWESWQQQVEDDADRAEAAAEDSEAWAVGERGGEPVPEGDETYHNNAKYWADQAEETLDSKADKTDTVLNTTLSRGRKANTTVGQQSFAFGYDVEASGAASHAEGYNTKASGTWSHAEGDETEASGQASHAEGYQTKAKGSNQHVSGVMNVEDNNNTFAEIVGNGFRAGSSIKRSNGRALDWNGNEYLKGDLYVQCDKNSQNGSKVAKVSDIPEPVDISGKADKVEGAVAGNFAGLDAEGNLTDSGSKASDFLTEHQDIRGKADKVTGATNGNLAGLDGNGNLTDSGKKAADFVPVTSFRADAMPMSETDPKTVAQTATELKSAIDGKADLIRDTVSNVAIASVPDAAANLPLTALRFAVNPIQAGSGDPSPQNQRAITGRTSAVVSQCEKNLFDKTANDTDKGYVSGYYLRGTGELNQGADWRISEYIKLNPSTAYTISGLVGNTPAMCFYDKDKNFVSGIQYINNSSITFTTGASVQYLRLSFKTDNANIVQLEQGSTASPYTAYTGTTHPVQFGSTVYGGEVDWIGAELSDETYVVNTTWGDMTNATEYTNNIRKRYTITTPDNKSKRGDALCNVAPTGTSGVGLDVVQMIIHETNDYIYVTLPKGTPDSTAIQIVYYRATPIEISLSNLDEIRTVEGVNNLWADCGDVLELTYGCDTKAYVEKRLSASQTLMELIVTANRESEMKASKAYSTGNLLIVNGTLYKATTSIANGATLTPGTNVTATTVAAELAALA